ncbi:MAG TPA: aminotransferase class V-fold PLP-dependent enzyme [Rhodothermales bacterium]|nr:aminotransferase class V-fold PLP-dependent enzyme [Rhodothermales bacterium]
MPAPDARALLARAWDALDRWEAGWGPYERPDVLDPAAERLDAALDEWLGRMTAPPSGPTPGNYPFFHPRYAGQMLKPPHPVALAAYAAAMRVNPNNHALDGGPPSGQMEKEVVGWLATMFGFPAEALGHLTGGGTVANLEALWVARELHPDRGIAYSADAHYTHGRMAGVLKLEATAVPADAYGRMDLDALEALLKTGRIGTVVLTAATTGLGSVDPIAEAIPLARRYGARVHVDAAYGGFFCLLVGSEEKTAVGGRPSAVPAGFPAAHFRAIATADSVVVDPHKHGLQPYGCGAVLFRDPAVGRFYSHDSPYTYFTSDALHLGEISLECSRPGAAAAALWLTLRALPLRADEGLGPVLAAGLGAARDLAARLDASDLYDVYTPPETDIVVYAPRPDAPTYSALDALAGRVFDAGMADADDPIFLSLFRLDGARLAARFPALTPDRPHARVLRSVLMKPEHALWVPHLAHRLDALATAAR